MVSTAADALVSQAMRSIMIAKLTNVGAAALLLGTLTVLVATGLPATGWTMTDPPAAKSSSPGKPAPPAGTALLAGGGRQPGHSQSQSSPAPPIPIVRDKIRCQDDGNLVLYTPDSKPIWSSGTSSRSPDDFDHVRFRVFPKRAIPPQPVPSPVPTSP